MTKFERSCCLAKERNSEFELSPSKCLLLRLREITQPWGRSALRTKSLSVRPKFKWIKWDSTKIFCPAWFIYSLSTL